MQINNVSFTPHPKRATWFVAGMKAAPAELERAALAINDGHKARGYFALCGCLPGDERHRLYLVPDDDPVQVARDFEVGAHGEEHPEAIEEIRLVQARNPIVPFFADSAGCKFKFTKPISDEFVHFLEATLDAGMDEQMMNEDGELNVRETGFVHLWWD